MIAAKEDLWAEYARTRSVDLRNRLVEKNYHLLKMLAARVYSRMSIHLDYEEVLTYGAVGLIDAVEKYDYKKGVSFKTYAWPRMYGAIMDELRKLDTVRRMARRRHRDFNEVESRLAQQLGRAPRFQEVLGQMPFENETLARELFQETGRQVGSLDVPLYEKETGDHMTQGEIVEYDLRLGRKTPEKVMDETGEMARKFLCRSGLNNRERLLLLLYYHEGQTFLEIGKSLGLSESRISQMHSQVLDRIRTVHNLDPAPAKPRDRSFSYYTGVERIPLEIPPLSGKFIGMPRKKKNSEATEPHAEACWDPGEETQTRWAPENGTEDAVLDSPDAPAPGTDRIKRKYTRRATKDPATTEVPDDVASQLLGDIPKDVVLRVRLGDAIRKVIQAEQSSGSPRDRITAYTELVTLASLRIQQLEEKHL